MSSLFPVKPGNNYAPGGSSGGGGGGATVKAGNPSLTTGISSLAVVFSGTAFSGAPAVVANLISPDGTTIVANVESITSSGFTAVWGLAIPAGWSLSWVATPTTQ